MKIQIVENLSDDSFAKYKKSVLKFKIKESILKTHFKELMKVSSFYNSLEKTGYISKECKDVFLNLVSKIEKSDSEKCKASHSKTIQNKIQKRNKMSFEDYCEDFLDQHIALMSESEKKQAYAAYNS